MLNILEIYVARSDKRTKIITTIDVVVPQK
jgi:hypothetical protein